MQDSLASFQARKAAIAAAHLARDKNYIAKRRKTRFALLLGMVKVTVGTVSVLAVLKTVALAVHGPVGYSEVVSPALDRLPADHSVAALVAPDRLTTALADALRPYLNSEPPAMAYGPPLPPDMDVN